MDKKLANFLKHYIRNRFELPLINIKIARVTKKKKTKNRFISTLAMTTFQTAYRGYDLITGKSDE